MTKNHKEHEAALLMDEEAQEAEKDILEEEAGTDDEREARKMHSESFNIPELEIKGYSLQQAYRKIGGMGK